MAGDALLLNSGVNVNLFFKTLMKHLRSCENTDFLCAIPSENAFSLCGNHTHLGVMEGIWN